MSATLEVGWGQMQSLRLTRVTLSYNYSTHLEASMRVTDPSKLSWLGPLSHREGGVAFLPLMEGVEGMPDNFMLSLVKVEERFETPRHRHAFDQVRFMLEGDFGFGDQVQRQGTIGYFCEGTYYTQQAFGPSLTLLLQVENASRTRYLSRGEMERAIAEMSVAGGFGAGIYRSGGRNKDGYEALWEHVTGEEIVYQAPRYERPVIMHPEMFAWRQEAAGVARRPLAVFSERLLSLAFWRLEAGASKVLSGRTLGYVLQGDGALGMKALEPGFAFALESDEEVDLQAYSSLEILVIGMPQ